MLSTLLYTIAILLAGVALLSVGIMIKGKFPNIHVGKNPAMRKRGIGCVEEQDKQARMGNHLAVDEKSKNNK